MKSCFLVKRLDPITMLFKMYYLAHILLVKTIAVKEMCKILFTLFQIISSHFEGNITFKKALKIVFYPI